MSINGHFELDGLDRRLLNELQQDCDLTHQQLADRLHASAPTCFRRVAIVSPEAIGRIDGHGLTALIEVSLDRQSAESLDHFEQRVADEVPVQQCYRVSPGPDFVLVVFVSDMPAYHAFAHRVLSAEANVRNVRTFFSIRRSKFDPRIPV
jgi:Lrp/AsnC family transcriptional regulator, leucine-responsive regulatory protein